MAIQEQIDQLVALLRSMKRVAVAFSGGVDSAVVAAAAHRALGNSSVAVTADSPSVPRSELSAAKELAQFIGIRHIVVPTHEIQDSRYVANDGTRCYFCKSELYSRIESLVTELNIDVICSGANLDDLGDYRPGLTAAAEHHIRHPLQEVGLKKSDVRAIAQSWKLPVWDKPASPCLSSRLAPGLAVTAERLQRVEQAEALLHELELSNCRVRYHDGDLARIEVEAESLATLAKPGVRQKITDRFHQLGFRFVTLDLDGFRSGNLNQLVNLELKSRFAVTQGEPS